MKSSTIPPSIGPGRYSAFSAERSSRLFGLSLRHISRIPPDSNWNIASVRPEPNNCIVFSSLSEVLAQSTSMLSARFMLNKQSLMMVRVLSARKSIFKTPTFSRSDISYWVVTSSLLLTAMGISSCSGFGVVITPKPLQELIPIAVSSRDEVTTQYEMSDLEKVGVLKMDFLALNTLTIISDCLLSIKRALNIDVDWAKTSLNDEKTMQLFGSGRTDAIFQFESGGMREICRKLKPKSLEDLSALNALYRPGPIDGGMVDDFIQRHHSKKAPRYLVAEMKEG